jgi:hypothetical protein
MSERKAKIVGFRRAHPQAHPGPGTPAPSALPGEANGVPVTGEARRLRACDPGTGSRALGDAIPGGLIFGQRKAVLPECDTIHLNCAFFKEPHRMAPYGGDIYGHRTVFQDRAISR